MDFSQMFEGLDDAPEKECPLSGQDAIDALKAGCERFMVEYDFKTGDMIVAKDGVDVASKVGDRAGNPAVFIDYRDDLTSDFDQPRIGAPYALLDLDCLVGWINGDGSMTVSVVNSQFYEPFNP